MYNQGSNGSSTNGNHIPSNNLSNSSSTGATEIDAKRVFRIFYSYKWMILFVVLICMGGMYAYTESVIPQYQGKATLLITQSQDNFARTGNDMNSMLTNSFGIGKGSTITNELGILQSKKFATVIAEKILATPLQPDGRLYPLLWKSYPEDASMVGKDELSNRIQSRLSIIPNEEITDMLEINYKSSTPHEAATVTNIVVDSYTQFSVNQNRMQVRSALDFLNQEMAEVQNTLNQKEEMLRNFMNREKLVELDSQTQNMITAMANLENERQAIAVQKVGVNSAIESRREELDRIKPGFVQNYSEGMSTKLNRYQFNLAELETERMLMMQKNPNLRGNPNAEASFQRLNDQIANLKNQITELAEEFIGSNEHTLGFLGTRDGDMVGKISDISEQLTLLEIDSQQYEAQTEVLEQRLEEYQESFEALPDNMIEFAQITRDIETNEQLYLTMSQQIGELTVWEQTQASSGRVVDYSEVPSNPVEPRSLLLLTWAFVMGLFFSIGLVYVREINSTKINSIEKLLQKRLTLLSVIPDITSQKLKLFGKKTFVRAGDFLISPDLITVLDPMSYASEAYRRMLSNIMFSQADESYRSILVTSSNKAEGKSSIIANLATVYAESGKVVAIVDCDFRHPTQHKLWGLSTSPGSVDVLSENISLERVIQPTVVDNVHVIPAGKISGNPAELVQSRNMKEMIEKLKNIYDVVLIDSPPFGFITDAAPLMQYVDGLVLVARFNQSTDAELDQCLGNLKKINANIIGMVMTGFNHKKAAGYNLETSHFRNAFENYNRYNKEVKKKRTRRY
ncbi:MAG: polysaccharide biosynthesis tyrosine autokinase [Balneolales bacterium]